METLPEFFFEKNLVSFSPNIICDFIIMRIRTLIRLWKVYTFKYDVITKIINTQIE
jgi:hypothetical protein